MATTSIYDIKLEFENWLRNQKVISIGTRGVTTSTDTGTFSSAGSHTLAVNPTLLKNVRSVVVAGITLAYGDEYTVNFETGVITFSPVVSGAYTIIYDQGSTDKIYQDFPQPYLKLNDFPRVGFDIISGNTSELGIGATTTQSEYIISIVCYDKSQSNVEEMIATLRSSLIADKKNFYYIPFITLGSTGPMLITPFGQNKIVQRNQDVIVKFVFES